MFYLWILFFCHLIHAVSHGSKIKDAIDGGKTSDLAVALKGDNLDLKSFIKNAGEKGRLDMVVELAKHGDLASLKEAFSQTIRSPKYVNLLLRHTKDHQKRQEAFVRFVTQTAQSGNYHVMNVFLNHLNYMDKLSSSSGLSMNDEYADNQRSKLSLLEALSIYASLYSRMDMRKLIDSHTIKIFNGNVDDIHKIVRDMQWDSKLRLLDLGIIHMKINLLMALADDRGFDFKKQFLKSIHHLLLEGRADFDSKLDFVIQLLDVYPDEVTDAILEFPQREDRVKIFTSFIERLKYSLDDLYYLSLFNNLVDLGDIELMKVYLTKGDFWGKQEEISSAEVAETELDTEILPFIDNHPNLSFWMMVAGLLQSDTAKNQDMVKFLISKIDNLTVGANTLLQVAVKMGRSFIVEELLKEDNVVNAGLTSAINLARKNGLYEILELLERRKNIQSSSQFSAGAA